MNDGYFPAWHKAPISEGQQPIAWVQTASGARMPLDLARVEQLEAAYASQMIEVSA